MWVVLWFLKFFPTCFALFNAEAYSASNVIPVRPKACVSFEFHEANVGIVIPGIPISIFIEGWWRFALSLGLW